MANTPTLTVNGWELPKLASVTFDRSVDSLADTFSVSYSIYDAARRSPNPLTFDGDEPVVLALDGETLLTGYIDIPRDGVFSFYTKANNGSRLLIGPSVVVYNDGVNEDE